MMHCPQCRFELSKHYEAVYARDRRDARRRLLALCYLVAIATCIGTTILVTVAGCGDSGSRSSKTEKTAARSRPIELRWDPQPGPIDAYRVYIYRRNGKVKTYLTSEACFRGPSDPQAQIAWVTAIRDGLESEASAELELPCP